MQPLPNSFGCLSSQEFLSHCLRNQNSLVERFQICGYIKQYQVVDGRGIRDDEGHLEAESPLCLQIALKIFHRIIQPHFATLEETV